MTYRLSIPFDLGFDLGLQIGRRERNGSRGLVHAQSKLAAITVHRVLDPCTARSRLGTQHTADASRPTALDLTIFRAIPYAQ